MQQRIQNNLQRSTTGTTQPRKQPTVSTAVLICAPFPTKNRLESNPFHPLPISCILRYIRRVFHVFSSFKIDHAFPEKNIPMTRNPWHFEKNDGNVSITERSCAGWNFGGLWHHVIRSPRPNLGWEMINLEDLGLGFNLGFTNLGGGFKYFLFSPRKLGKWSKLTSIFFRWVGSTTR